MNAALTFIVLFAAIAFGLLAVILGLCAFSGMILTDHGREGIVMLSVVIGLCGAFFGTAMRYGP